MSIMWIEILSLKPGTFNCSYAKKAAVSIVVDEIFRSRRYIHYSYKGVHKRIPMSEARNIDEIAQGLENEIINAMLCEEILDALSVDDRILIISRYWGKMLIREIAEVLNISESMVSKRRIKILHKIRGMMVQEMATYKIDNITTIEHVATSKLKPNRWNPNVQDDFMFQKTKNSLQKFGFVDPIKVRTDDEGLLEIVDGEHRWKAAKELKLPFVPILNYGAMPDHIAQQLTLAFRIQGEDDREKLSAVMTELQKNIGKEQLMEIVPYPEAEVDSLLSSIDLSGAGSQEPEEEWCEIICRFPKAAESAILDEFKRIGEIMKLSDDKPPSVRNGLILENICVLSGDTPTESLE